MAIVLIVEDTPAHMTLAVFLLKLVGHTVLMATDAQAGLRLARDQQPNLILSGLEATVLLKRDDATRAIPVIAITVKTADEALAAGCDAYIQKPVSYREFMKTVAAQLARI